MKTVTLIALTLALTLSSCTSGVLARLRLENEHGTVAYDGKTVSLVLPTKK